MSEQKLLVPNIAVKLVKNTCQSPPTLGQVKTTCGELVYS